MYIIYIYIYLYNVYAYLYTAYHTQNFVPSLSCVHIICYKAKCVHKTVHELAINTATGIAGRIQKAQHHSTPMRVNNQC